MGGSHETEGPARM